MPASVLLLLLLLKRERRGGGTMKRIHGILAGAAGAAVAWMALLGSDLLDETFVLAVGTI